MSEEIKCVILKINGDELLMPNAAVAEIVPIKNIINVANKPGWMLGYLDWRGHSVPLISFEAMGNVRMPSLATGSVKAAILFSIGEDSNLPFMSILMQDAPTVVNVKEEDIISNKEEITHPAIEDKVMMADGTYSIVNIEKLESIVKQVMM
ncbi:MAG: chemotaxis protein CheW [Gammaproteobacteria bacterium]|nr:chemotaxis protein CheW [Gammaproteobacteria bacterium]